MKGHNTGSVQLFYDVSDQRETVVLFVPFACDFRGDVARRSVLVQYSDVTTTEGKCN